MIEISDLKNNIEIKGQKIKVEFNKSSKVLSILSLTSNFYIDGITPAINLFIDNQVVTLLPEAQSTSPIKISAFSDNIGLGKKVIIKLNFQKRAEKASIQVKGKLSIILYDDEDYCILQLHINSKGTSYPLHSLAPLRITSGILRLNNKTETQPEDVVFFEHGFQSWSPSKIHNYKDRYEIIENDTYSRILQNCDNRILGHYASESVTAISDVQSKGSMIIGFCTLADSFSRIVMDRLKKPSKISWLSAYSQFDNIPINLLRKQPVHSEELFITFQKEGQGYYGLIKYAEVTGNKMKARVNKPLTGWCSWYYFYEDISNKKLISNVNFFDDSNIPLDLIQLDDGYQIAVGDYTSFNEKFPNGLTEFTKKTHKQGKLAGIWIAPFFAAENSLLFKNNPEWFLKARSDKNLITVYYNWQQPEYALDLTCSEVQNHIRRLLYTIIGKWHLNFIKIDFIYSASIADAYFTDSSLTRAQVYRLGVSLIRETIGGKNYLLGCGAPIGPSIGLVDAMRVSEDTKEQWESDNDLRGTPSLKAALLNTIYRSFMHNNFWINDPDCLIVREDSSKLSEDEVKLQLTIFGLSGGQLLISEDMTKLDKERLNLALKLIPPFPETAIPIDSLYEPLPTLYLLETRKIIGKRALLAIINWQEEAVINRNLKLKDILRKLSTFKQFFVFDWWEERLLGLYNINDNLPALKIPPHACKYLCFVPIIANELPLIISSTLHISQGCYEIVELETSPNFLKLEFNLPGEHNGDLFILVPSNVEIITSEKHNLHQKTTWGYLYKIAIKIKDKGAVKVNFRKGDED